MSAGARPGRYAGCVRGFHQHSAAWYSGHTTHRFADEIMVGMYATRGGCQGEFAIRWHDLGGSIVPRLEVYDDAWRVLQEFDDLLRWMASVDNQAVTPAHVADALRAMGIRDLTSRAPPVTAADKEYQSWMQHLAAPIVPAGAGDAAEGRPS